MSTPTELRALAARAQEIAGKATPGPWGYHQGDRWIGTKIVGRGEARSIVAKVYHNREKTEDDAAFIAASRELVPELADAVIALADEIEHREVVLDNARDLAKRWQGTNGQSDGVFWMHSLGDDLNKALIAAEPSLMQMRAAQAEAKCAMLRARIARVEALCDKWDSGHSGECAYQSTGALDALCGAVMDVRAALAEDAT